MSEVTGNIALIGFMAAGKTTVGQALAARLGYTYLDTDELIVDFAAKSIPEVCAEQGEEGFRRIERAAVRAAAERERIVIACGGGVPQEECNVAVLRGHGRVVYLRLTPETATERILADGRGRPMIDDHVGERTPERVLARVRELLERRTPAYLAAADVVIDVDGRTVDELVDAVVAACGGG
ncbi:MAG: AAA family ATPase [Armatimonadetes bacterium]|nr:AAA family ATPase [Armatimonadota bacterium]